MSAPLHNKREVLERVRRWALDNSMSESGPDDGPEVDTYEIGYESAQGTVLAILNGWGREVTFTIEPECPYCGGQEAAP